MQQTPDTIRITTAANKVMHNGKFLYDAVHGKDHVSVTADNPLQNGQEIKFDDLTPITDIFGGAVNITHKTYHYTSTQSPNQTQPKEDVFDYDAGRRFVMG